LVALIVALVDQRPLPAQTHGELPPYLNRNQFGNYNPTGRLAITIPRHAGQLPAYYR
jgi:hypothetical protein